MRKKIVALFVGLLTVSMIGCGAKNVVVESSSDSNKENAGVVSVEVTISEEEVVNEPEPENEITIPVDLHIKELFAEYGMKAGTCISAAMIDNKDQREIILDQFNSITMENIMKPDYLFNKEESIKTGELTVEFNKDMIKILDFAKENGLAVRGHTLVWYSQTPAWIFHEKFDLNKDYVSRDVMLARLESYFKQVFGKLEEMGYIDLFYAYDIVNEAWMEDGSMRANDWQRTIGDDYIYQTFKIANEIVPQSIDLYYNDYNEQFKTSTLVSFVESLKDENGEYLIDGVGFQAHLYTLDKLKDYFKTMDAIAALGVKVQLTELDVCLGAYKNPLMADEENLKTQGRFYYELINGIIERVENKTLTMDSITFWGFADGLSWRKEYNPCLYNRKMEPKYSYYGVMQLKEFAGFDE